MVKIGDLELVSPIITAPMAGVTDLPFRQILREYGAELCFTEMVSSHGLVQGNVRTKKLVDFSRRGGLIGIQLFGSEPGIMGEAAEILQEEYSPDIIDINMCCPAPKVTKTGAGAALLQDYELAERIVKAVKNSISLPLTVKMRKGFDEGELSCIELARRLQERGVDGVSIHARSREQFYEGRADRDVIARAVENLDIPVVASGDIFTPEDAADMQQETGCEGVMLARGMQGNPWLVSRSRAYLEYGRDISPPDFRSRIDQALAHMESAIEYYGEERAVPLMRKHLSWYIKGLPCCSEIKERINRAGNRDEVADILGEYLQKLADRCS